MRGCTHPDCMGGPLSHQQNQIIYERYHSWASIRKVMIKNEPCVKGDAVSLYLGKGRWVVGNVTHILANGKYDVRYWTKTKKSEAHNKPDTTSPIETSQGAQRKNLRRHISNRMPRQMRKELAEQVGLTRGDDEVGVSVRRPLACLHVQLFSFPMIARLPSNNATVLCALT